MNVLSYVGEFHIYFNRHLDWPRVWCIATPTANWEVQVCEVHAGVHLKSCYRKDVEKRPDHSGPPAAWFEGIGRIEVDDTGTARIFPE